MKPDKTNAMRILDKARISYEALYYENDRTAVEGSLVAQKIGVDARFVFKTLVTQGVSKNFYVFVIPVAKELNLKAAAKAVNEKSVSMIQVKDLFKITGYVRGGCSPIGMKKSFHTILDISALSLDFIVVSGGKIGIQIKTSPNALLHLLRCSSSDLTQ